MSMSHARTGPAVSAAEVERRIRFADAVLGAAGHEVTDPALRELSRQVASGELTAEEAIARGLSIIDIR